MAFPRRRVSVAAVDAAARAAARGAELVAEFRARGHLRARLDPLGRCRGPLAALGRWPPLDSASASTPEPAVASGSANESRHGEVRSSRVWARKAWNSGQNVFVTGNDVALVRAASKQGGRTCRRRARSLLWAPRVRLEELLEETYCNTIGFETSHLACPTQRLWWRRAAEVSRSEWQPTVAARRQLLLRLLRSTLFEQVLGSNYPSSKRFGLDGCESLIPGLFRLCQRSAAHGVESVQLGMSHRGRLNVLSHLLGKPMGMICAEMRERVSEFHVGDVKYHLGITGTLPVEASGADGTVCESGRSLSLTIAPNPSHLEVVGPVVLGQVRALQDLRGGGCRARKAVMGIVMHGDAAFAGLGISLEVMQMSALEGYSIGGAVHIVLDNQIGFTTEPHENRTSAHASGFATGLGIPVLHVNADDVEAVDRVFGLAADWRAEFGRDIVVVLVGYRRFGHNELDVPEVTQPISYRLLRSHPTVAEIYTKQLEEAGVLSTSDTQAMSQAILIQLQSEYAERSRFKQDGLDWLRDIYGGRASRLWAKPETLRMPGTGLALETLQDVMEACCTAPQGFTLHPNVAKILEKRLKSAQPGGRIDFATAEMLAFGSTLLHENWSTSFSFTHRDVRLSGQDSRRGTFNQRHAAFIDVKTAREWVPLRSMASGRQGRFTVLNSPLSEMGVLAFEYGYSLGHPEAMVCWEAQFGDFANNAQVAIDQFIASGEEKWGQASSITLLLPHGYDGQGPDHSSARLERFLQLVNDDPDHLPGATPEDRRDIDRAFDVLNVDGSEHLTKEEVIRYLSHLGEQEGMEFFSAEQAWEHMRQGRESEAGINRAEWRKIMQQWYRRNAEVRANIVVVNLSTPAQYYHVLRRQAHRRFKKPLIVMAPKYLLHHAKATSAFEDLGPGSFFRRVIVDYNPFGPEEAGLGDNTRHLAVTKSGTPLTEHPAEVRRLVLCSGQMYYKLSNARKAKKIKDVAILRLEQIAPFPHDRITETIAFYPNADVIWCQEEPKNMGAWFYVQPRLATALRSLGMDVDVRYVGRPVSAATATGSQQIHLQEEKHILETVFAR